MSTFNDFMRRVNATGYLGHGRPVPRALAMEQLSFPGTLAEFYESGPARMNYGLGELLARSAVFRFDNEPAQPTELWDVRRKSFEDFMLPFPITVIEAGGRLYAFYDHRPSTAAREDPVCGLHDSMVAFLVFSTDVSHCDKRIFAHVPDWACIGGTALGAVHDPETHISYTGFFPTIFVSADESGRNFYATEAAKLAQNFLEADDDEWRDATRSIREQLVYAIKLLGMINDKDSLVSQLVHSDEHAGRGVRWKYPRAANAPTLLVAKKKDVLARISYTHQDGIDRTRSAHFRRRHWRRLTSERFKAKRGKLVQVRECWCGPKDFKSDGKTYEVRLDL